MLQVFHFAAAVLFVMASAWVGSADENKKNLLPADTPTAKSSQGPAEQGDTMAPRIAAIDQWIGQAWAKHELKPSQLAEDGPWCRRVFLDLIGRIPTAEEFAAFQDLRPRQTARAKLVHSLLFNAQYEAERIEYWSGIWVNFLIGRTGGSRDNGLANRDGLRTYFREALRSGRSYQQMTYELIAAEGANRADAPEFNGAVNYLLEKLQDGTTVQATAHVSRFFLGRQVQCTQCHNHPFNDWKQNQFWEFDAFLRQTVALRRYEPGGDDIRFVVLTNQDFRGEGKTPEQAETYYELRNGELRSAYPRFLDGTTINASGILAESHRRQALAKLVSQSDLLAPALVNRLWAHFLGYGFTKPADDTGPHNLPSHPELLDYLAQEFRGSGYDLRQLMEWIVLSKPYQLSSPPHASNRADDPQSQRSAWFSRFYLRQMSAEQLYQSLLVVTHPPTQSLVEADASADQAAEQRWLAQFLQEFGTDEGGESTTFDGTIPQTLVMFQGEMIKKATSGEPGTWLAQVIHSDLAFPLKVRQLFHAALARRPTPAEMNAILKGIDVNEGQATALQDLWWALLNSNEFILIH